MLQSPPILFLVILAWSSRAQDLDASCGIAGKITPIREVPWIASVQLEKNNLCIGTILNTKYILTVSDCVEGKKVSGLKVRVGNARRGLGTAVAVCKVIIHPQSDKKKVESYPALLNLCEPLTPSEKVKEIAIIDKQPQKGDRASASVSGWGSLSWWRFLNKSCWAVSPNVLRKTKVQLLQVRDCAAIRKSLRWSSVVTDQNLCTAKKDNVCTFNQGAPLVINGRLAGLLAYSECNKLPEVYVNLFSHKNWIETNTKDK
ncbi:trypsin-3-like [Drosophila takahashii]|uniref:trypsin-3-like n=1 Tax=Drosophila takahashii TaxID=29030 RepID=UPI001CF9279B|nr:trypsin-3-like [Drosophila takahashii]